MESVYKIKIRTDPDLRGLYPSERRYSASNVLGLGVIHIAFAAITLIFASLNTFSESHNGFLSDQNEFAIRNEEVIHVAKNKDKEFKQENLSVEIASERRSNISYNATNNETFQNETMERAKREVIRTLKSTSVAYLSLASFTMAIGAISAGITGLLAWKRWYIDNNIKWFFLTSCMSIVFSASSLISTAITMLLVIQKATELSHSLNVNPDLKIALSIHIMITSIVEFMLSTLSAKIAYKGMMNSYPDDIIIPKSQGKIEINTIRKGNKKTKIVPPDILNHFHMTGKFAKYFPRVESNYLPNAESNSEYQERVRKFLSSNTETSSVK